MVAVSTSANPHDAPVMPPAGVTGICGGIGTLENGDSVIHVEETLGLHQLADRLDALIGVALLGASSA